MNETVLDEIYEKPSDVEYATFWRRVGASFIDGIILSPLTIGLAFYTLIYAKSFMLAILPSVITLIYKIWMEKTYNATLGKIIVGIHLRNESLEGITFGQAITRNYFYFISIILGFFTQYALFGLESMQSAGSYTEVMQVQASMNSPVTTISYFINTFFLIDCLFMLGSKTKQTLHDRWAGTVVIKK